MFKVIGSNIQIAITPPISLKFRKEFDRSEMLQEDVDKTGITDLDELKQ